jgi:hypothetical protein
MTAAADARAASASARVDHVSVDGLYTSFVATTPFVLTPPIA